MGDAIARHEIIVECTPEQVFDYLCDLRNELEWNAADCESAEKITEGPMGEGTKFQMKWKGSPNIVVELTHYNRPHAWKAHSDGAMESNFSATVEPHPEGAKLVTELRLTPHGFFKLFFPIFKIIFNRSEAGVPLRIQNALNQRFAQKDAA